MTTTLHAATIDVLPEVIDAVSSWQDGQSGQVHPGDLGWNSAFSAPSLADDLRLWRRDGRLVAIGMVDSDSAMIRMSIDPQVDEDEGIAAQVLDDLSDADRGVLPADRGSVEARSGTAFRTLLADRGWLPGEPWTPLRRELAKPVEDCGLPIVTLDASTTDERLIRDRVSVQRASFAASTFTIERWHAMAASPAYRNACCLVAYDADEHAVAAATVWSAGQGKAGHIEPLGAHHEYRGHGYGRAITLAAASQLAAMGASSVLVCTPASNVGAVAAYQSAGFERLPDVADFERPS